MSARFRAMFRSDSETVNATDRWPGSASAELKIRRLATKALTLLRADAVRVTGRVGLALPKFPSSLDTFFV